MRLSDLFAVAVPRKSAAESWRRSWATCLVLGLACRVALVFTVVPARAQGPQPGAPASDVSNIPKSITDTFDRVQQRNGPNNTQARRESKEGVEREQTCLLPPLTLAHSPLVTATELQVPAKARKEYSEACALLKKYKSDGAEKHLRKAVEVYPKYSAAWVTLGQVLAAQQNRDEAHNACSQASKVEPSYVPAYLCLADLAARDKAWDEVLKLSGRAIELDPASNPVAYEFNASANLRINNLKEAERSALRALAIDKNNIDPRVHFVLAQIYEKKGDVVDELAQLREYLKFASDPGDVAMVQQYLSAQESHTSKGTTVDHSAGQSSTEVVGASTPRWGPADIDEAVPPVQATTCPLPQILKETSRRTLDLIENLQRFSANDRIEQIEVGRNGRSRNAPTEVVNYVAQIEEGSSGYPTVKEYRLGSAGVRQAALADTGTAAFALMFHHAHIGNFDFRCEGLSELQGSPSWQVHFEESADSAKAFHAIRMGGSLYLPRLKGRVWIAADSYNVVRIETDLMSPVPQLDLQLEHQIIIYAPVEFPKSHVRLWLPESASFYIAYHGHRYQRVHNFSQFQLFSVDAVSAIKEPPPTQFIAHR